jgi:hypothetical protein
MDEWFTPLRKNLGVSLLGWIADNLPEFISVRGMRRVALAMGVVVVALAWLGARPASADDPIRVGLYIQFEDGSSFTQCVELAGVEATGLDVLRQSGLGLVFEAGGGFGSTICKIGETGCDYPAEDCFCQCLGTSCHYWTYWYAEDDQWKYSPLGASNHTVRAGGVEGWVWGNGREAPPVEVLTQDICPVPVTATSIPLERSGENSTPPPPRPATVSTLTRPVLEAESESGKLPPQPPASFPLETVAPTPALPAPSGSFTVGGSSVFFGLVVGLSALGIVLLGLAYVVTRRRT